MPVSAGALAGQVGIDANFKNLATQNVPFLPQRVALIGQGSSVSTYSTTKRLITSAKEAYEVYGAGSPIHLAALQLLPENGDGIGAIPLTVYPLADTGTAAAGDITPSGSQIVEALYTVKVNNIESAEFSIAIGASVATIVASLTAAINGTFSIPIVAVDGTTVCNITSKWKGASGNDIDIEIVGSLTAGTAFTITQPASGATNPTVDSALAQIGDVWETAIVSCLELADSTALATISAFGEGRWGSDTHKPFVSYVGNNTTAVGTVTTITGARKADRVNAVLVSPGSKDLPLVIAAREVARIVVSANQDPAKGYGGLEATGLVPGADGDQWTLAERELAVNAGASTVKVKNGVVTLADIVTFHHPDGDLHPAYRYVANIVKLQTILNGVSSIFDSPEWDGAPLVPDTQNVTNPSAKQPKTAKAAIATLIDALALAAIISDPATAKAATTAVINGSNPNRLDITMQVQLSGNTYVTSIDLNFGFFFGS